jgi:hypothetical protein
VARRAAQPMWMTSQPFTLRLQAQPIGQLLRGPPVLRGESETFVVRSYLRSSGLTSGLVLGMPCVGSVPTSKPESAPGRRV